jgi:hypothetical protein
MTTTSFPSLVFVVVGGRREEREFPQVHLPLSPLVGVPKREGRKYGRNAYGDGRIDGALRIDDNILSKNRPMYTAKDPGNLQKYRIVAQSPDASVIRPPPLAGKAL